MASENERSIRIALAQTWPISAPPGPPALEKPHSSHPFATLQANLVTVEKYVKQAAEGRADVVVFPEYFLQGIVNEGRQYLCQPSRYLQACLQSLAKRYNISIVGTIVHGKTSTPDDACPTLSPFDPPTSESKSSHHMTEGQLQWANYLLAHPATVEERVEPILHNTAFFIEGGTGRLIGEYVKRNLWHPEREYLTAGEDEHRVFQTKWGKIGFLICWDMSHPGAAQDLAAKGADIIFCPTYWLATDSEPIIHNHAHSPDYEKEAVSAMCFARAFETETVWVMCNAGGDSLQGFMGGSGVWAPMRGKVGGFGGSEEGLKIVDLDLAVLDGARRFNKIREDWSKREAT